MTTILYLALIIVFAFTRNVELLRLSGPFAIAASITYLANKIAESKTKEEPKQD